MSIIDDNMFMIGQQWGQIAIASFDDLKLIYSFKLSCNADVHEIKRSQKQINNEAKQFIFATGNGLIFGSLVLSKIFGIIGKNKYTPDSE